MTADLPDQAYLDHLLATAKSIKSDGTDLDIILTIMGNKGPTLMNLNPWWNPELDHRQVLESLGGMLGFGLDAQTIFVVTEAWVSQLPAEGMSKEDAMAHVDSKDFIRPRNDPNRTEAIMIHELRKDGFQYAMMCPLETKPSGIEFGEPKTMTDHVDYTFKYFFIGLKKAEEAIAMVVKAIGKEADDLFTDSDKTVMEHARIGAIKAAKSVFKIDLEEGHATRD